jgi:hypothetical protein
MTPPEASAHSRPVIASRAARLIRYCSTAIAVGVVAGTPGAGGC